MAAVLGVADREVHAAFRGETREQVLATCRVPMKYPVVAGDKVREMHKA